MLDIAIACFSALLILVTAYLGVHVTLHPATTDRHKTFYKIGFWASGIAACLLIGLQTYRNNQSQSSLQSQLNTLSKVINGIPPQMRKVSDQLGNDQRPWIVVDSAAIKWSSKLGMGGFVINAENLGKTPAQVHMDILGGKNFKWDEEIKIDPSFVKRMPNSILLVPNRKKELMTPLNNPADPPEVEKKRLEFLRSYAKGAFRIDGAISYTAPDFDGGFTRFCFVLIDGVTVGSCFVDNFMN